MFGTVPKPPSSRPWQSAVSMQSWHPSFSRIRCADCPTTEPWRVEDDGKDEMEEREGQRRWNGRKLVVLGDTSTEAEEPYANLRSSWLGEENAKLFRSQQAATDSRK